MFPALSVAREDGSLYFSVFEDGGFSIYRLGSDRVQAERYGPSRYTRADGALLPGASYRPPGGST